MIRDEKGGFLSLFYFQFEFKCTPFRQPAEINIKNGMDGLASRIHMGRRDGYLSSPPQAKQETRFPLPTLNVVVMICNIWLSTQSEETNRNSGSVLIPSSIPNSQFPIPNSQFPK